MKDAVRNLLFIVGLLFAISYDCFTLGVNYDKKYKLYPESVCPYCCMSFGIPYGQRWERLGAATGFAGVVILISMGRFAFGERRSVKPISIFSNY